MAHTEEERIKLAETLKLQEYLVMQDYLDRHGWDIDEVREIVDSEVEQIRLIIKHDKRSNKCPGCGRMLVIKHEHKEVVVFCNNCDYEG